MQEIRLLYVVVVRFHTKESTHCSVVVLEGIQEKATSR
jgi:hypothetical protein